MTVAGTVDAGVAGTRWGPRLRVAAIVTIAAAVVAIRVMAYRRVGADDIVFFTYASLAPAAYLLPGIVLLTRRDGHPIGWLLCLLGLEVGFAFSSEVGVSAIAAGEAWLVWLLDVLEGSLLWLLFMALMVLFPDGLTAQAPRHRRVGRAVLTVAGAVTALELFVTQVGVSDAGAAVLPSPVPLAFIPRTVVEGGAWFMVTWIALLVALVGLVSRYRGSRAVERRQYRWVLWSLTLLIVALVVGLVGSGLSDDETGAWWLPILVGHVAVPVAFMVAILRYRLYEIDRVVNRSVSYALLTVLLVGVYASIAVVPAVVFDVRSDLLVAAATLSAAALFRPLRRRVQTAVDRRFNRTRYDAARAVDGFTARLRGQTAVDALVDDLVDVVATTVQPTSASVWVRRA